MCHHSPQQKSSYKQYLHDHDHSQGVGTFWIAGTKFQIILLLLSTLFQLRSPWQQKAGVKNSGSWCSHLLCSAASLCCLSSLPDPRWVHHIFPEMLLVFLWKAFLFPFKAPTRHNPPFICQNIKRTKYQKEEKEHFCSFNMREAVSNLSSCTCSSASSPSHGLEAQLYLKESCSFTSFTPTQHYQDSSFTPFPLSWQCGGVKMSLNANVCVMIFKRFFWITDWPQKLLYSVRINFP